MSDTVKRKKRIRAAFVIFFIFLAVVLGIDYNRWFHRKAALSANLSSIRLKQMPPVVEKPGANSSGIQNPALPIRNGQYAFRPRHAHFGVAGPGSFVNAEMPNNYNLGPYAPSSSGESLAIPSMINTFYTGDFERGNPVSYMVLPSWRNALLYGQYNAYGIIYPGGATVPPDNSLFSYPTTANNWLPPYTGIVNTGIAGTNPSGNTGGNPGDNPIIYPGDDPGTNSGGNPNVPEPNTIIEFISCLVAASAASWRLHYSRHSKK